MKKTIFFAALALSASSAYAQEIIATTAIQETLPASEEISCVKKIKSIEVNSTRSTGDKHYDSCSVKFSALNGQGKLIDFENYTGLDYIIPTTRSIEFVGLDPLWVITLGTSSFDPYYEGAFKVYTTVKKSVHTAKEIDKQVRCLQQAKKLIDLACSTNDKKIMKASTMTDEKLIEYGHLLSRIK